VPRTLFTADQHFGHKGILQHRSGPFRTISEMDAYLVAQWNAAVGPEDEVWCLGDFALDVHGKYLKHLAGKKHLILGNHDEERGRRVLKAGWTSVSHLRTIVVENCPATLCHYALRTWPHKAGGGFHFFGHSHGRLPADSQSCDVGVDCWDFAPVTLKQIMFYLRNQRPSS
jgi:calcineurin-like phosphoesterase family protein